jgi:hypothetical protein
MGKAVKKVTKKVSKAVKKVTKIVVKSVVVASATGLGFVVGGYAGAAYGFTKSGGFELNSEVFAGIGSGLSEVGLDSASNEVNRWGSDIEQVGKVLSGQYHSDMKKVEEAQTKYNDALEDYKENYDAAATAYNNGLNELLDRMDSLIAFHEIFKMAASNRIENYGDFVGPSDKELLKLYSEYKKLADKLKKEYDFIISLKTGGVLEKVFHSMITVIGGITHDMTKIMTGEANSEEWKRVGMVVVAIVLVVIAILAAIPTGGASLSLIYVAIAVLAVISTLLMLDSTYAEGTLMGAIMDMLDFLFNDIMQLDQLIGSDFEKFDSDHEDHADMAMYLQMTIGIAALILSLGTSVAGWGSTTTNAAGQTVQYTSVWSGMTAGVGTSTIAGVPVANYKALYDVYSTATSIKDFMAANKAYETLKGKLAEDLNKVDTIILNQTNKNFMKHYKDTEYFLNDQQLVIDRYLYSMTEENMYVDPYGTTPVANIRFTPDKKERSMSFGFEDLFNSDNQAGGNNYFKSMLYMT